MHHTLRASAHRPRPALRHSVRARLRCANARQRASGEAGSRSGREVERRTADGPACRRDTLPARRRVHRAVMAPAHGDEDAAPLLAPSATEGHSADGPPRPPPAPHATDSHAANAPQAPLPRSGSPTGLHRRGSLDNPRTPLHSAASAPPRGSPDDGGATPRTFERQARGAPAPARPPATHAGGAGPRRAQTPRVVHLCFARPCAAPLPQAPGASKRARRPQGRATR